MIRHKWPQLLFSGLLLVSLVSCSPSLSFTPGGTATAPLPNTRADKSTALSPTATPAVEPQPPDINNRQWPPVPITQTQSGGIEKKPIVSGIPIPTPLDPAGQQIVTQASENLARRLGVGVDQVELGVAETVAWPDTSLGCPQPGTAYAQVITPGYRIVLTAGGKTYEYHADTRRRAVYCESRGTQPLPGDESTESVRLAKEDLARRLGVSVNSITVSAVIGQEFSTDAFFCRTSKERIAKEGSWQVVSGQSIHLSVLERRYEYHAAGPTVIFCRPLF